MDGILVRDSDWTVKLSADLYRLFENRDLCDLGIMCNTQNVIMVHRCVMAAASETIRGLSMGNQVYNLVTINNMHLSQECWASILRFIYTGKTTFQSEQLCDVWKISQVLQVKPLEKAVNVYHMRSPFCTCKNITPKIVAGEQIPMNCTISDDTWLNTLFEGLLDLLVKQSLCNMTITAEKPDKTSTEIMAHLCILVAASKTIRSLVVQKTDTYSSVKVDSISYNTWLYLLEYIYTSRVSIVKSNIQEVWSAAKLLHIDGLSSAVAPFTIQSESENVLSHPQSGLKLVPGASARSSVVTPTDCLGKYDQNKLQTGKDPSLCSVDASTANHTIQSEFLVSESAVDFNSSAGAAVVLPDSSLLTSNTLGGAVLNSTLRTFLVSDPETGSMSVILSDNDVKNGTEVVSSTRQSGANQSGLVFIPSNLLSSILSPPTVDTPSPAAAYTSTLSSQLDPASLITADSVSPIGDHLKTSPTPSLSDSSSENGVENAKHLKTAVSGSLYFCNNCGLIFTQKVAFVHHQCSGAITPSELQTSIHDNDSGKVDTDGSDNSSNKLTCPFCKKIFARTWTLNVHLRTHTGERPYVCEVCNKAFSDKSNMRQHSLIHYSKKEYYCPNCNQAFAQKRYMKKHYAETCRRKCGGLSQPSSPLHHSALTSLSNIASQLSPSMINTRALVFVDSPVKSSMEPQENYMIYSDLAEQGQSEDEQRLGHGADGAGEGVHESVDGYYCGADWVHPEVFQNIANTSNTTTAGKLLCSRCNKVFKTERQLDKHRCMKL